MADDDVGGRVVRNSGTASSGGGGSNSGASNNSSNDRLRYRCVECGKGFITPSKLQRHSYSHTGLRPFHCDICGKSFSQSANLKTHVKNTHPEVLAGGDVKNVISTNDSLKDNNFPASNASPVSPQ